MYYDSSADRQPDLSGALSATNAYNLVLTGSLPSPRHLPASVSHKRGPDSPKPSADMASVWATPTEKLVWKDGDFLTYDLDEDPGELAPAPYSEHPLDSEFRALAESHRDHLARRGEHEGSAELAELLDAMGYVD